MTKRIVLTGDPRTKKNSQRICVKGNGQRFVKPSSQYEQYERACLWQLRGKAWKLEGPLNLCCRYYMATRRKVDLVNLLEATSDILVRGGVIIDDNSRVVAGYDGSRVLYDKQRPRVEIRITDMVKYGGNFVSLDNAELEDANFSLVSLIRGEDEEEEK